MNANSGFKSKMDCILGPQNPDISFRDDENESELDRIIQTAFKDYDFENNVGQISFSMFDLVRGNFENYFRLVFSHFV